MGNVRTKVRAYEAMLAKRNGSADDSLAGRELRDPLNKAPARPIPTEAKAPDVQSLVGNDAIQRGQPSVDDSETTPLAMAQAAKAREDMAPTSARLRRQGLGPEVELDPLAGGAWKQVRQALSSPGDRKAAVLVKGMNPALAQQAIQYGATVAADPIAKELMSAGAGSYVRLMEYLESRT